MLLVVYTAFLIKKKMLQNLLRSKYSGQLEHTHTHIHTTVIDC